MKIDRLLQMVLLFVKKRKMTALYLAEHFDVTVKTIRRDIDTLTLSGIPIYTEIGRHGGYCLHEDYVIDRRLFSKKEKQLLDSILDGLELDLLNQESKAIYHKIVSKDQIDCFEQGSMVFDLRSFEKSKDDQEKLRMLDMAIKCQQKIRCHYYKPNCEPFEIDIMPIKLVLKVGAWYVHALYKNKKEFRYYKLNRMQGIEILDTYFDVDKDLLDSVNYYDEWYGYDDQYHVKVRFFKPIYGELDKVMDVSEVKWDQDYFDYVLRSDVDIWLLSTLLSFREHVIVYDETVRKELKALLKKMSSLYE